MSWGECQSQTLGFKGAIFKSFKTNSEAQSFLRSNNSSSKSSAPAPSSAASAASQPPASKPDRKRSRRDNGAHGALAPQRKQHQPSSSGPNCRVQITLHFDGGSRGNPGLSGAGAALVLVERSPTAGTKGGTTTTYSVREYCGPKQTNNYAEYTGLLAGLKRANACLKRYASSQPPRPSGVPGARTTPLFQLQIYGDSKLIMQQLRGVYQCRHHNILPLFQESQQLIMDMKRLCTKSEILYDHVYREHNKIADALANEAMDQCRSWTTSTAVGARGDASPKEDGKPAEGLRAAAARVREASKAEVAAVGARINMKSTVAAARKRGSSRSGVATETGKRKNHSIPEALEQDLIDVDDDSDNNSHFSC